MIKHTIAACVMSVFLVTGICGYITTLTHVEAEEFNAHKALEALEALEERRTVEQETEKEERGTVSGAGKQNGLLRYDRLYSYFYEPNYLDSDNKAYPLARIKKDWSGATAETVEAEAETTEEVARPSTPHYAVKGHVMPLEWQDYLYSELQKYGTEELFKYLIAQAYQESQFKYDDVTNNIDYGLYQYRITWWRYHCEQAGIYRDADIFNPYTQIYVRAFLASKVYKETGSIEAVMKRHINGGDERNERYWSEELKPLFERLERIN